MRKTNNNVYFNIHHATHIDAPRDSRRFYDARKPLPTEREARETRTVRSSSRTCRSSLKHRLEHYVRASRPSTAPESANEEPNTFRMKKKSCYLLDADPRCEITPSALSVGADVDASPRSTEGDQAPRDARPRFVFEDENKFLKFCARHRDEKTPSGLSLSYTLRMGNIWCLAHDSFNLAASQASVKAFFEKLQRRATLTAKRFLEHSMPNVMHRGSVDVDQTDKSTSKANTNEEYDVLDSHECEEERGESETDDWSFVSYDA